MTFETADDVLEHFGVKGMRWGVRKATTSVRDAGSSVVRTAKEHPVATKRIAIGAAFAATLLAGAALGGAQVRRNTLSSSSIRMIANDKASRVLINEGSHFARSKIDMELLFNAARQVKEGLIYDDAPRRPPPSRIRKAIRIARGTSAWD